MPIRTCCGSVSTTCISASIQVFFGVNCFLVWCFLRVPSASFRRWAFAMHLFSVNFLLCSYGIELQQHSCYNMCRLGLFLEVLCFGWLVDFSSSSFCFSSSYLFSSSSSLSLSLFLLRCHFSNAWMSFFCLLWCFSCQMFDWIRLCVACAHVNQ